MKWLELARLILGDAEKIVPVFIHNPKSLAIEAVIATTADAVVADVQAAQAVPVQSIK